MKIDTTRIKHGIVCYTFDDSKCREWLANQELFAQYNAHATFFFHGEITTAMISAMKQLSANGHSIGLHSLGHVDAPPYFAAHGAAAYCEEQVLPQLRACRQAGIPITSFAYPNNCRNDETDDFLGQYFQRFRAGLPDGKWQYYNIAEEDQAYLELSRLSTKRVMPGNGLGELYCADEKLLDDALERAARENLLITFFSHSIAPDAQGGHVKTALLEHCLQKSSELGMKIAGFDELP